VTEEIWQRLPRHEGDPESIMIATWPSADLAVDEEAEQEMELLQSICVELRRFRHDHHIPPRQRLDVVFADGPAARLAERYPEEIKALASLGDVRVGSQPDGWSRVVVA